MASRYVLSVIGLDGNKYYHQVFDVDDYSGDTLTSNPKKAYRWTEEGKQNARHECVIEGHISGKNNVCSLNMHGEIEVDMNTWAFEPIGK